MSIHQHRISDQVSLSEVNFLEMSAFADRNLNPIAYPPRPGEKMDMLIEKFSIDASNEEDQNASILKDALDVVSLLDTRATLPQIAQRTENVHAFGIGHLLHTIFRKKLVISEASPERIISECYATLRSEGFDRTINRLYFIGMLKSLGHVPKAANDKTLKPAGTNPCLKALSMLMADSYKIPFEEIASSSRIRAVVDARFVAIFVMRTVCGHSLSMIGQNMGNRDHTTILNSINKITLSMKADPGIRQHIERLCEKADTLGVMQNRAILLRQIV